MSPLQTQGTSLCTQRTCAKPFLLAVLLAATGCLSFDAVKTTGGLARCRLVRACASALWPSSDAAGPRHGDVPSDPELQRQPLLAVAHGRR